MKKSKPPVFRMPYSVGESSIKNSLPQYITYHKRQKELGRIRIIALEFLWMMFNLCVKFNNRRKAQKQQNG